MKISVRFSVDLLIVGGSVRGVEIAVREKASGKKVFLATPYSYFGDDICSSMNLRKVPAFLKRNGVESPATPMSVKRTLDRVMILHDVPFAFQTFALGIRGDCVIFADRSDLFAVRARAIVDATAYGTVARQSAMPFPAFVPGKTRAVYRALAPCSQEESDFVCMDKPFRLIERETEVELAGWDPESCFRAELEVRRQLWEKNQAAVADRIEFPDLPGPEGSDPAGIVFTPEQYAGIRRPESGPDAGISVDFEPARSIRVDIAVAGGGTAGAAAGIPGAKAGLRTLVLERLSHLGGMETLGCIASYWFGLKIGYTKILDERVLACSNELPREHAWDVANKECAMEAENLDAGTSVWFDSSVCGVSFREGFIRSILAATPFGGVEIFAEQFIDCTGNAELAFRAGAPTEFSDESEPAYQGCAMSPVVPGMSGFNTDYMFTVDDDPRDAERAFLTGRDRFPQVFDLAQIPGTRERRRIVGEIVLRAADFYAGCRYPDTVTLACSDFDTHGFTVDPLLIYHPTDGNPFLVEIPFRAFLSPGVANLMTTGLGISAQRDAMPLIRMIADVQNQGYAAGLIAAEAVMEKKELRSIRLDSVQKKLAAMGFFTPDRDVPENDLNRDAEIFSRPDLPALEADFRAEPNFEKAVRLAFLGSDAGAGLLRRTLEESPWDDGWDYKGMGQGGRATSRLDAAIHALSGIVSDAGFLMPRLREMKPETSFSHFRAVCLFLMKHPYRAAAPELDRLLSSFECHAVADWKALLDEFRFEGICDVAERNLQLRELYLAGALHACDPENALAESFLHRYRNGVHRLYAMYAEKWGGK